MLKPEDLRQISYFSRLAAGSRVLNQLAQATLVEKYEAGQVLFLEGETNRGIYHLVEGRIRVYKAEPGGREQVLRLVGPGATFNEVPVFDEGPTAANAEAVEPSLLWVVPGEVLLALIDEAPELGRAIIRTMAGRLRHLTSLVGDISLKQVNARVAQLLLNQAGAGSILGAELNSEVTGQLTQQQMAAMVGTVRDMVGRSLRTLQKAGAIEMQRGYITILDEKKLQDFI